MYLNNYLFLCSLKTNLISETMKRLQIYSVALVVVMLCASLPNLINDFMFGLEIGWSQADSGIRDITGVGLRPYEGGYYTSTSDLKLDSTNLGLCINNANIGISNKQLAQKQGTPEIRLFNIAEKLLTFVSLAVVVAFIWIVVLIIRVLYSVFRTKVFEAKNIKRISRIGWILLSIEIIFGLTQYLRFLGISHLVDFGPYHINFSTAFDTSNIIVAIIILLMNELLRIATKMKEEQDLTI